MSDNQKLPWVKSALQRSVSYLLALQIALHPVYLHAQMVPDQADPSKAPTMATAPNGVPVVNITAPSGAGVSQNRFTDFNVDSQGVVFNNSTSHGTSQLGGVLLANPNLTGSEARIILNEVTGANASQLKGFMEVFGGQAQFVLSNPNGITCSGCGFINTPRATLTTGSAQITGGDLTGLDVDNQSQINIEGLGLNAQDIAALDLVARSIRVNAPVNAQDLKIFAGRNLMDYGARTVTQKADDGSTKPALALDGALFGGMYARKIEVIATEDGVGVKLPDNMAAGTGDIAITADGGIALKNLSAKTGASLTSGSGDITLNGAVNGGSSLVLNATNGTVTTNAASIAGALNNVAVQAANLNNQGQLIAGLDEAATGTNTGSLNLTISQTLTNSGTLTSGQDLTAQANQLTSTGLIQAGGVNSLSASGDIAVENVSAGTKATITSTNGGITVNKTVNGGQETELTASNGTITVGSNGSVAALNRVALDAQNITNNGEIAAGVDANGNATATGILSLTALQTLANNWYITSGDSLIAQANQITNDEGFLLSVGAMTLEGIGSTRASSVSNLSGIIETAKGNMLIRADSLINKRKVFSTSSSLVFDQSYSESSGNPPRNPNGAGISPEGWAYLPDGSTVVVPHPDRGMEYASYYDFGPIRVRQYEVKLDATSAASMLASGGTLTVDGGTISNEYSTMSSRGDMVLTGASLVNSQMNLTKDLYFTGPNGNYNRCVGGPCRWFGNGGGTQLVERVTYDTLSATIQAGGSLTGSFTGQINNSTISQTVDDANIQRSNQITAETPYKPTKLEINLLDILREIPGGKQIEDQIRNSNGNDATVETRDRFANPGTYFAGEDFLNRVPGANPGEEAQNLALSRNAESHLIRHALVIETGKAWLDETLQESDALLKKLVDGAVQAQQDLNLTVGIALTSDQINALTSNMVWYVNEEVNGQQILVPRIYLASSSGSVINDKGTLVASNEVRLTAGTTLANSGNIEAGQALILTAQQDLTNSGGRIQSGGDLTLESIAGDVAIETETYDLRTKANEIQTVRRTTGEVISGGDLTIKAGNDLRVTGASVTSAGQGTITAGRNVEIGTIALREKRESIFEGGHDKWDKTTVEGSTVMAETGLTIEAGQDLQVKGSAVASGSDLALKAGNNLQITSDQNTATYDTSRNKKSFWKSSNMQADGARVDQQSSALAAGGNITLEAGSQAQITASVVNAGQDLAIKGANVTIDTAQDFQQDHLQTKKSGFFAEGSANSDGAGFSVGLRKEQHKIDTEGVSQVASNLRAGGALSIEATENAKIESAGLSAGTDLSITAGQDLALDATSDSLSRKEEHKIKQAGISVSLQQNVTRALDSIANLPQSMTSGEGSSAAKGISAASGVLKTTSDLMALQKNALSASVSVGVSSSEQNSSLETTTARVATVQAGQDVNLTAGNDLTAKGAAIVANRDANLQAGGDIVLESAQNTLSSSNSSSSKSASVGVTAGVGMTGYTVSANGSISSSESNRNEQSTTHVNALVRAGRDINLTSGEDTTLSGAQLAANNDVNATIGGDLTVESRQDTGSISGSSSGNSIGLGFGLGGGDFGDDGGAANGPSGNGQQAAAGGDDAGQSGDGSSLLDRTSINSSSSRGSETGSTAWVNQQTGIIAGGDVTINVGDHTQLTGGIIASTGGDVALSTDTFDHQDLQDHNSYEKKNLSISGSTNLGGLLGGDDDGASGNNNNGGSGEDSSILDSLAALPTIEGGLQSSEKEQVTRATIAAPNGKTNIIIRTNPDQGLEGLNQAFEKAQEITRDEKTSVEIFVSGESLAEVASGFKQTREAIATATDKVEAIADYIESQLTVLPESLVHKGEAVEDTYRDLVASGMDPETAYSLLESPVGKLLQIKAFLEKNGGAEDLSNLSYEEREALKDIVGTHIEVASLVDITGLKVKLQDVREGLGRQLLEFYKDGFFATAEFLRENEDDVEGALALTDIIPGAVWGLMAAAEGGLEVVNPAINGEQNANQNLGQFYANEFEAGVKRIANAKEGLEETSAEYQKELLLVAIQQIREMDVSGEDAALAGTIAGAFVILKTASRRLTAGGSNGNEIKELADSIEQLAKAVDDKLKEHDAVKQASGSGGGAREWHLEDGIPIARPGSGNGSQIPQPTTKYVKVDTANASKGTPEYEILNNPPPNTRVELDNGTTFQTGAGGYVDEITYQPVDSKGVRDSRQTAVGKEGIAGDVGGHIQACRHGGTCDRFNLFPQNSNFNNSGYKTWENEITRSLQRGDDVGNVVVRFQRSDPHNPRPDSVEIEYQINGNKKRKQFRNQQGG